LARRLRAGEIVDFCKGDPVAEIMGLTDGRGVDVAIEALGRQETFAAALRVLRPRGALSSLVILTQRSQHSAGCLRGRPRGPSHRHHAVPPPQGADAPPDRCRRLRPD
jgi:threonine dehydrogenase-like Zn-dependent dehydrogenase